RLNSNEIVLTPANVNSSQFGKLFTYTVDAWVYAQPLYIENLSIPLKGFHNVVYVATENDTVYAFDADGRNGSYLWKRNLTNPAAGVTAVPCADLGACNGLASTIGITGTPVIDRSEEHTSELQSRG